MIKKINQLVGENNLLMRFFMDDANFGGETNILFTIIRYLQENGKKFGFNFSKLKGFYKLAECATPELARIKKIN